MIPSTTESLVQSNVLQTRTPASRALSLLMQRSARVCETLTAATAPRAPSLCVLDEFYADAVGVTQERDT